MPAVATRRPRRESKPARPFQADGGVEYPAEEPTGQYPDPVFADIGSVAAALEDDGDEYQAEDPTGQYPDPVFANVDPTATAQAKRLRSRMENLPYTGT